MIRIKVLIFALAFALLGSPIAAIASDISNALYYGTIIISNNSTANTNVATVANISTTNLISGGYLNSTANNTVMRNSSGADVPFMPAYSPLSPWWCMWVSTIGEDAYLTYLLYTGNSFDGEIRYFPDSGGMVIVDNASLELGIFDFSLNLTNTFINMDAGYGRTLISKPGSYIVSANETVDEIIEVKMVGVDTDCLDFVRANNDWVRIPDDDAFSFTDGAGTDEPFTIIIWVNFDDATISSLVRKRTNVAREWSFNTDGGDLLTLGCEDPAGGNSIQAQSVAITGDQGAWHHYAGTYDGLELNTGLELYRDGVNATNVQGGAGAYVGMTNGVSDVNLGSMDAGTAQYLDGLMAEIKVYNAELTQTEIEADFNGSHRIADLVAWWRIDEGDGLPRDSSGNGHNANQNLADWVDTFPNRLSTVVYANNVASDEYDISINRDDEPALTSWANDVVVGVSMGQGMLPVKILEEITLDAPAASVTFSGITGNISLWDSLASVTSRHLVVVVNAISDEAADSRDLNLQFNGDGAGNYNWQRLTGIAGADAAFVSSGTTSIQAGAIPATNFANAFGGGTILIPHAFNTSNHKSIISLTGAAEERIVASTGRWADTDAIDIILLYPDAGNFDTGSTFILGVVDERYLVEEQTNAGADFSVDFQNISQTGHDLVVIGYSQSDLGAVEDEILHEINNDGGAAAYPTQEITGRAGAAAASQPVGDEIGMTSGDNAPAEEFGAFLATYSQYAGATNQVHFTSLTGYHESTGPTSEVRAMSGRWDNVAAITRLELYPNAGGDFKAGSLFSLYRVPRYVIDRQELTAPAATITFNNIPQNYQALQLNIYGRTDAGVSNWDRAVFEINNDNIAANYDRQVLLAIGAGPPVAVRNAADQAWGYVATNALGANEWGGAIYTFPQYARTDGHKHGIVISGSSESILALDSVRWESNAAINRIELTVLDGANWIAGSVFELVGVMPTKPLRIDIDGETKGIADGNADAFDSTFDWVIGGDTTPYIGQYEHMVNAVLRSDIEWRYRLTFPDLSGNGNPATPTFRGASADANIIGNMTAFTPISQAMAPAYVLGPTNPFISSTPNITGNFTVVPPVGTFPLAGVIVAISNATATPPQLPLLIIACFVILAASLTTSYTLRRYGSGTLIVKAFVIIGIMGIFIALGDFGIDWWMTVIFAILATALAMASRQQSWR